MDNIKVLLKHHHNKIKFSILTLFTVIILAIGVSLTFSLSATRYSQQCSTMFDTKDLDSKKRICCNSDHYNSSDSLCKIKCDTLEVSPDSQYCQEILDSQEESPLSKELSKMEEMLKDAPKCLNFSIKNTTESLNYPLLKPSNPLLFEFNVEAQKIKPTYFVYEYYTIVNNDYTTIKPISFEQGKNLISVSPAKPGVGILYRDSFQALYENFFKQNLNDNRKIPQDILVTTSIIDDKNQRIPQPQNCNALFRVSELSSYCREFKITSTSNISPGVELELELVSNLPTTDSFELRFLNLDNFTETNSIKTYKPVSFDKENNTNKPLSFSENARGENKTDFSFEWSDFYQKDLNHENKYPERIRIEAYIKPSANTPIQNIRPCTVDFEMDKRSDLNLCKDLSVKGISKNSSGQYVLKKGQEATFKLESTSKDLYDGIILFYNADNIDNDLKYKEIKALQIYFQPNQSFSIIKSMKDKYSISETLSYEDFDRIDYKTGKKPQNIIVSGQFRNKNYDFSYVNKDECTLNLKIE
jgi:hypothetical protein